MKRHFADEHGMLVLMSSTAPSLVWWFTWARCEKDPEGPGLCFFWPQDSKFKIREGKT